MPANRTQLTNSATSLPNPQQFTFKRNEFKMLPNALTPSCFVFLSIFIFNIRAQAETTQGSDYQSLSLDDCLALARKYNPALGGATERIRELVADYRAARSGFYPRLELLSYYQRLEPNRLPPGGSTAAPSMDFNNDEGFAGITAKQILFNGGNP